ncbi:MAG: tyrosine-type recombinase/integrase [Firmicutes bacterium]|nr:tyrosine-type recombinase/integrase [Bacillota bacterium]
MVKIYGLIVLVIFIIAVYKWGTISTLLHLRGSSLRIRGFKNRKVIKEEKDVGNNEGGRPLYNRHYHFLTPPAKMDLQQISRLERLHASLKNPGVRLSWRAHRKAADHNYHSTDRFKGMTIESHKADNFVALQAKIDSLLETKKDARIITPAGMRTLIAATDKKWRPLIITACCTGMRAVELIGLLWEDIDFYRGRISVKRIFCDGRFRDTKPESQNRSIIVPPIVIDALKEHRVNQIQNGISTSNNFIFTSSTGKPLSLGSLEKRILKPALVKAGMGEIDFEDIRYSYAMALLNSGENVTFVYKQLGLLVTESDDQAYRESQSDIEKGANSRLGSIFGTMPFEKDAAVLGNDIYNRDDLLYPPWMEN